MNRTASPGERLRSALQNASDQHRLIPFVGIYDLFSASLAAERFDALFLSGFGLSLDGGTVRAHILKGKRTNHRYLSQLYSLGL